MLKLLKNWASLVQSGMDYDEPSEATGTSRRKSTSLSPIALAVGRKNSDLYILGQDEFGKCILIYADEFGALPNPIPVGDKCAALGVDRDTNTTFVANTGTASAWGNTVCVVQSSNAPPEFIEVGLGPIALSVSAQLGKVYVANYQSVDLTIIDSATLATATVKLSRRPLLVAVDALANKIYVLHHEHDAAENESAGLSIIDGKTQKFKYLPLPGRPHQMVIDPMREKLYISDALDNNGIVLDVASRTFKTWRIGFTRAHLLINAWENRVYAHSQYDSHFVTRFDFTSGSVQIVPLPFTATAVAINLESNHLIAIGERSTRINANLKLRPVNTFPAHEYGFITYHVKG